MLAWRNCWRQRKLRFEIGSGYFFKQIGDRGFQFSSDYQQSRECEIALPALNLAHMPAVHATLMGKCLLCPSFGLAQRPNSLSQCFLDWVPCGSFWRIHRRVCPSKRRLYEALL